MYISQVEIDYNNRMKIKDLNHLGVYHSWVEDSFPNEINKENRTRKLWRIDKLRDKKYLIIVSKEAPDLKKLEKFGVENSAKTKLYDKYLKNIRESDMMRFRVTLNPVVSKSEVPNKRGRLYPYFKIEDQMKFLYDRAFKNGFLLNKDEFFIVDRNFERLNKEGKKLVSLSKVTYEGVLKVNDKEIFYRTLTQGFGKKKAYGCGLMTVIPMDK